MKSICIHSAPRTASRTAAVFLETKIGDAQVSHNHFLLDKRISHFNERHYKMVANAFDKNRIYVITIVRNPIWRNISDFWRWTFIRYKIHQRQEWDRSKFIQEFLQSIDHYQGIEHIQREVEPFWGFNIYDREFPRDIGYQIIKGPRDSLHRLLIIRFENIDKLPEAASKLLGIEIKGRLPHIGKSEYYPAYLQGNLGLPKRYVAKMLDHQYTKHFYADERDQMWSDSC